MDKKLKTKWVKALRSGKYKQGRLGLYNSESRGYCCLGVLASVVSGKRGSNGVYNIGYDPYEKVGKSPDLVSLNDDKKQSFSEIADWIEQNIPAAR